MVFFELHISVMSVKVLFLIFILSVGRQIVSAIILGIDIIDV